MAQTDKSSDLMSESESSEASKRFAESLERLSLKLWQRGVGAPPEDYGVAFLRRVRAAELIKQVSAARAATAEARLAGEDLGKVELLLQTARGLAFGAVNEPGRRERQQDQVEFAEVLVEIDQSAGSIVLAGEAEMAQSQTLGVDGELRRQDLCSLSDAIRAIQVIDWGLSEVNALRGRLGLFQTSKLTEIGSLLQAAIRAEVQDPLAGGPRPFHVELLEQAISCVERGWVEEVIEAQYAIYCVAMSAIPLRGDATQRIVRLCEQCLSCLSHGVREEERMAVRLMAGIGSLETEHLAMDRA
jgi:hypothetical protein